MLQAEHERATSYRALHFVRVHGELVANRRSNQIGSVRIEALLDEEVDLTEVKKAEADVLHEWREKTKSFERWVRHLYTIRAPSVWMGH